MASTMGSPSSLNTCRTPLAIEQAMQSNGRNDRVLTRNRVQHLVVLCMIVIPVSVGVCILHKPTSRPSFSYTSSRSPASIARRAVLNLSRQGPDSLRKRVSVRSANNTNAFSSNVEETNISIVLENIQLDQDGNRSEWMFSVGNNPFEKTSSSAYYANENFTWNADGRGDSTCGSGGSGRVSRGYIDPEANNLGLKDPIVYTETSVRLDGLKLEQFVHVPVKHTEQQWDSLGNAGDSRRYKHGHLEVTNGGKTVLSMRNIEWLQNVSYPGPAGPSAPDVFEVSAYFVGKIDAFKSDREWVSKLDPFGIQYALGVVKGAAFGEPAACYPANSYWITLRGFPDISIASKQKLNGPDGSRPGVYQGSSQRQIQTARALATVAKTAVTAVVVVAVSSATTGIALSVATGAGSGPPGGGVARLLTATAFTAKVNQIAGFHTDAMHEFGSGLDPFLVRFSRTNQGASGANSSAVFRILHMIRQAAEGGAQGAVEENHPTTITAELFGDSAFYVTIVVVTFLVFHFLIWLLLRKKPLARQVKCHAWMLYVFSITMSYLYTASILNSMQYFRSNVPFGSGKPWLYVIATVQLFFIGLGFTIFFFFILMFARRKIRENELRWIPKEELADPELRRNPIIAGEYVSEEKSWFHDLFSCFYSALSGPRTWLAGIELTIIFVDATLSALLWNEKICLGILVALYAVLFLLFLVLSPFANKVEGGLVCLLGAAELLVLVLQFIGTLGSYAVAERVQYGGVILRFIVIGLAVLCALYVDVIPTLGMLSGALRKRYMIWRYGVDPKERLDSLLRQNSNGSQWSGLDTDNEGEADAMGRNASQSGRSGRSSSSSNSRSSSSSSSTSESSKRNSSNGGSVQYARTRTAGAADTSPQHERAKASLLPSHEALVAYNAAKEAEVAQTMARLFDANSSSGSPTQGMPHEATQPSPVVPGANGGKSLLRNVESTDTASSTPSSRGKAGILSYTVPPDV